MRTFLIPLLFGVMILLPCYGAWKTASFLHPNRLNGYGKSRLGRWNHRQVSWKSKPNAVDEHEAVPWSLPPSPTEGSNVKPLMLLDIDHVLNCKDSEMNAEKHWPKESFKKFMYGSYPVCCSTEVIKTINAYSRNNQTEIRWLTTWDRSAQKRFSPNTGMDFFELARDPEESTNKAEAALQWMKHNPARKIIWMEDEIDYYYDRMKGSEDAEFAHKMAFGGTMLFIQPERYEGLTPAHFQLIDQFLQGTLPLEELVRVNSEVVARRL
jgi:hypothetical protein